MIMYELSFAKIVILREDVAEVLINDGVEMNVTMVNQYHEFLLSHLRAPFSLLINKINTYSYDFPAQQMLATLTEIKAMAVVSYNITKISTETVAAFPRDTQWNIMIFSARDKALEWLLLEQDHCTQGSVITHR